MKRPKLEFEVVFLGVIWCVAVLTLFDLVREQF